MKLFSPLVAISAATALFGVSVAFAQTAAPPAMTFADPPHKNLKILPQDMPRAQLLSTMKSFSQSLGVRCSFCHVGEEGKPLSSFDFASDAKDKKLTARKMLAMVHRINEQDFDVHDFSKVKVTCFTCHRGSTKPLTEPPPGAPNTVPPPPGAAPVKLPERGA
jgi:photosynthetic reaction center cytochrome c subunit